MDTSSISIVQFIITCFRFPFNEHFGEIYIRFGYILHHFRYCDLFMK